MVAQARIPRSWKADVGGLVTLSSLGYKLSSRLVWATKYDLVAKKKRKEKKKQDGKQKSVQQNHDHV